MYLNHIPAVAATTAQPSIPVTVLALIGGVTLAALVSYGLATAFLAIVDRRNLRKIAANRARFDAARAPEPSLDVQGRAMVLELREKADALEAALDRREDGGEQ